MIYPGNSRAAGAALLFFLAVGTVLAQPANERKSIAIARVDTAPRIDGVLDDPIWSSATVIDDIHQFMPVDHGTPSERSEFYLLYDDDNLYIGARLWDSEPDGIIARQLIQGQTLQFDDAFEFVLDPFNNMRSGYHFQLNPNGVRRDGIFENSNNVNRDWEGIWEGEARIDDEGWTAEVAIPFKTLNFDPANPDWGFTIARTIARKKEELAWSSYNRNLNPGTAGVLTGLHGLRQGLGLDVVPSMTVSRQHDYLNSDTDITGDPSLDVFYKITPSLTGVLTLNTDFSATEVDDRQVNLSRFSLFFPEKRDFFLQDADIFSFGGLGGGGPGGSPNGLPFFSRRIGLSAAGQPVDLRAGAKLTGRIGRWNLGGLVVNQAGSGAIDDTILGVARVAANVFDESSIGAIMTYGDPRTNLDNSMVGADFRYRNTRFTSTHSLTGNLWYQKTDSEGRSGRQWAWGAQLGMGSAQGLHGSLNHEQFGEDYNPALGFTNRVGIRRTQAFIGYRWRPVDSYFRSIHPIMRLEQVDRLDGGVDSQTIFARPLEFENHRGDQLALLLFYGREVLTDDFTISRNVVIAPGDYRFLRYGFNMRMAPERIVAPGLEVSYGEFYDGHRLSIDGSIDWRPNEHFFVGAYYSYNDIDLPEGGFQTRLIQMRANWAFNSKWSWVNLVQYDNVSASMGINSRLRWNPRAGEDMYLVINHNFDSEGAFRGLSSNRTEILLKYSRTFRF